MTKPASLASRPWRPTECRAPRCNSRNKRLRVAGHGCSTGSRVKRRRLASSSLWQISKSLRGLSCWVLSLRPSKICVTSLTASSRAGRGPTEPSAQRGWTRLTAHSNGFHGGATTFRHFHYLAIPNCFELSTRSVRPVEAERNLWLLASWARLGCRDQAGKRWPRLTRLLWSEPSFQRAALSRPSAGRPGSGAAPGARSAWRISAR